MEKIVTVVAMMGLFTALACAETIWWNEDMTEQIYPQSQILEAGPPVYCDISTGKTHEGGGYLKPGIWKLVMVNNPVEFTMPNSNRSGPRYEIWEQQKGWEEQGYSIFWIIRHYFTVTDQIGGWVDHGGGPRPLYYTHHKFVLDRSSEQPFFVGEWERLFFSSSADVDRNKEVDFMDLFIVGMALWHETETSYDPDVDGNGILEIEDFHIVNSLLGTSPDETMREIMETPVEILLAGVGNLAPGSSATARPLRILTTWSKIKNALR